MNIVMDINLTDFFTLVISVIALIVAFKNRRNNLRENLHFLQLDSIIEMHEVIVDIEDKMLEFPFDIDDEFKELEDLYWKFDELLNKHYLYLTDELYLNFYKMQMILYKEIMMMKENPNYKYNEAKISDILFDYQELFREFIGVDKLSDETKQLTSNNKRFRMF